MGHSAASRFGGSVAKYEQSSKHIEELGPPEALMWDNSTDFTRPWIRSLKLPVRGRPYRKEK